MTINQITHWIIISDATKGMNNKEMNLFFCDDPRRLTGGINNADYMKRKRKQGSFSSIYCIPFFATNTI